LKNKLEIITKTCINCSLIVPTIEIIIFTKNWRYGFAYHEYGKPKILNKRGTIETYKKNLRRMRRNGYIRR